MNAFLRGPGPRRSPGAARAAAAADGYPMVDLLPQALRDARAARALARRLLLVPLAALLVIAVGWSGTLVAGAQASSQADQAKVERSRLTADSEKYAGVAKSQDLVAELESARTAVMAPEVDWVRVIAALQGAVPAGAAVTDVAREDRPSETPQPKEPGLRVADDAIGAVVFTFTSPTLPAVSQLLDSLDASSLLSGASYRSLAGNADEGYIVKVSAYIERKALTGRFAPAAPSGAAKSSDGADR